MTKILIVLSVVAVMAGCSKRIHEAGAVPLAPGLPDGLLIHPSSLCDIKSAPYS